MSIIYISTEKDEIDKLIGELCRYSELNPTLLQKQFNDDSFKFVCILIATCWPNKSPPDFLTPKEFVNLIYELKAEHREWSNKLGAMILAADDCISTGNKEKAIEFFEYFYEHCPCKSLLNIAKIQKENLAW